MENVIHFISISVFIIYSCIYSLNALKIIILLLVPSIIMLIIINKDNYVVFSITSMICDKLLSSLILVLFLLLIKYIYNKLKETRILYKIFKSDQHLNNKNSTPLYEPSDNTLYEPSVNTLSEPSVNTLCEQKIESSEKHIEENNKKFPDTKFEEFCNNIDMIMK